MNKTEQEYNRDIRIFSWNINGIRAVYRKGFLKWLIETSPDILCLQEIRSGNSPLDDSMLQLAGYYTYWNSSIKLGYSGTALLSRKKPISIEFGLGDRRFDQEGRTIIAVFYDFTLINCYFPNGNSSTERLLFKLDFYRAFLEKCEKLCSQGHTLFFCGDLNTAHKEIDLSCPKKKSGFLPEERIWIDKVIDHEYIDTFRYFYPNLTKKYTWWSNTANSRERNIGWRFDYFFVAKKAICLVKDAFILSEVSYSDHCPIGIELSVKNW